MIPSKKIEDSINAIITAGNLTDLELSNITHASGIISLQGNLKVATQQDLPAAAENEGILYYVISEDKFYFSDGIVWRSDLTSNYGEGDSVALTLTAAGLNNIGQLGDGTVTSRRSPVTVTGGITDWIQVSAGSNFNLGVSISGTAYAWGQNSSGQVGDNTATNRSSPVTVVGGITNWSQVSAGGGHSLGVTSSGIAYGWGWNTYGELGDNTTLSKSSPVPVVGGITNWSQVSAGAYHSLGLTSTGIAYAWGYGGTGRLGDSTGLNRSSPVTVVGGITDWSQLSAGGTHSLGLRSSGILYAWGENSYGQLGDNTTSSRISPVVVYNTNTLWSDISAGGEHSLGVLKGSDIILAWGRGDSGRLGDGSTVSRISPVPIVGGIIGWSQVSAGASHSLGLTSAGVAYGWGSNSSGQLGDNTTSDRSSPVPVAGGITTWSDISAGGNHSLLAYVAAKKGFL